LNVEKLLQQQVEEKRVIFVGPSPILQGKYLGKEIDSFDCVIRTNGAIFLLDKVAYVENYGKRCDILCMNVQFNREMQPAGYLKTWRDKYGVKLLGMKTNQRNLIDKYSKTIPTFTLADTIAKLSKKIKGVLYGPIIMEHFLQYNPKELWFTGIDFYYMKPDLFIPNDYREYFPDYLPKKIRDKANIKNRGRVDPHDQYSNAKYMWQLLQKGKIKTHDFIYNIVKKIIEHPDYYNYEARLRRAGKKK